MKAEDREQIVLPPQPIAPEQQSAISRLQRQCFVELATVQQFHAWLDDKRQCRQACRVIGDSRTGKTTGDRNAPSRASVYRVLQGEIERQEMQSRSRSIGWQGETLILKTREGLEVEVKAIKCGNVITHELIYWL